MLLYTSGSGCSQRAKSKPDPQAAAKTVRIQVVQQKDITEVLRYPVDISPYLEVRIISPIPDRIIHFPWSNGDQITRGQRVATIYKAGLDRSMDQVAAEAEALDVEIENLQRELARSTTLHETGALSSQAFDQLKSRLSSSQARRRALQASLGQIAVNQKNAMLNAPISGAIANKMLEEGDIATPGIPLCHIMQIDRLKVHLNLIEADIAKVRIDQKVQIHLNALPNKTFRGSVHKILPYLNSATRTNTVEVLLENPILPDTGKRLLKPGMFGHAEIEVGKKKQVLIVDEQALLLDNRMLEQQKSGELLRKAFVIDKESTARPRTLKLGARRGNEYEVLDGLKLGERVVIRGQHGLQDGQKVEVVEAQK